jgi:hypothetical protein
VARATPGDARVRTLVPSVPPCPYLS